MCAVTTRWMNALRKCVPWTTKRTLRHAKGITKPLNKLTPPGHYKIYMWNVCVRKDYGIKQAIIYSIMHACRTWFGHEWLCVCYRKNIYVPTNSEYQIRKAYWYGRRRKFSYMQVMKSSVSCASWLCVQMTIDDPVLKTPDSTKRTTTKRE